MGLNAFFAFVVVGRWASPGRPGWAQYSGAQLDIFAHAVSYPVLDDLQHSLKLRIGITSGIGLFIALMGLKNLALLSPIKTRW